MPEFEPDTMFRMANEYDRRALEYGLVGDIITFSCAIPTGQSGFHLEDAMAEYGAVRGRAGVCVAEYQAACVKAEDWLVAVVKQFYADEAPILALTTGDWRRARQSEAAVADDVETLAQLNEQSDAHYVGHLHAFVKNVRECLNFLLGVIPGIRLQLPMVDLVPAYVRRIAGFTGDPTDIDAAGQGWNTIASTQRLQSTAFSFMLADGVSAWKGDASDAFWSRMSKVHKELTEFGRSAAKLGDTLITLAEGLDSLMTCIVNCLKALRSLLITIAGIIFGGVPGVVAGIFTAWQIGETLASLIEVLSDSQEAGGLISDACAEVIGGLPNISRDESAAVPTPPAVFLDPASTGGVRLDDGPPNPQYQRPVFA